MSVWFAAAWLFVAGPVTGVLVAWATGPFTWPRAAVWAAACQLALGLLYIATQSLPVRIYGRLLTANEVRLVKLGLAAGLAVIAGILVAAVTAIWQGIART